GHLIEQFLSPYYNRRSDEYGGSAEDRLRTVVDVLEAIRARLRPFDMAVGIRLNCDEMLEGGLDSDQSLSILRELVERRLIDFANLDTAVYPEQSPLGITPSFIAPLRQLDYVGPASKLLQSSDVVCMVVPSRLTSLADAEKILRSGAAD